MLNLYHSYFECIRFGYVCINFNKYFVLTVKNLSLIVTTYNIQQKKMIRHQKSIYSLMLVMKPQGIWHLQMRRTNQKIRWRIASAFFVQVIQMMTAGLLQMHPVMLSIASFLELFNEMMMAVSQQNTANLCLTKFS